MLYGKTLFEHWPLEWEIAKTFDSLAEVLNTNLNL